MRKKIHVLILTLILTLFAGSMAVQAEDPPSISAATATVNIGDDGFKLEMKNLKEGEKPRWISYNVNVARVDQDGNVTPVRKGTAIISSGIGFPRETCKVTVVEPGIKLDKTEETLYRSDNDPTPGDTVTLTAKINGAVKDAAKIEWKSSDESVAKVTKDSKGRCVVKAVNGTDGKAGEAVITAEANGKKASCKVTVIDSSISLNAETIQLSEGSSVKLLPTVVGEKKNVTWTSDKPNVATVSGGKITGKKDSEETVTVTATANGVSATCTVTVVKKQISINEKNVLLFVNGSSGAEGETKELKTNAKKTDNVIWTSSDNSKVKVKANSKDKSKATITAVGSGTAKITAKIENSEGKTETDTCVVEVKNIKEVITKESVQLKTNGIDKTCRIEHTMDGRRKAVWKSSKPAVVSVKDGVLTAKKAGSATVSVESNGYKDELDVVVVDTKNSISIALNHYEYTLYKIKGETKVKENGNTVALKAMINGKGRNAKWRSSNAKVAEVDKKGKVTAKSAGLACITAETDGVTAKCWISVKNPEIILDKTEFVIKQGEKVNLWKDASMAVTGATQSVKYTSSDKKKVAVDSKGVVTGKNLGQATITIYANGAEAVCNVMVSACGDEHKLGAKTTVRPASCEKSGLDEQTCSVCGGKVQTITPPLGHKFFEDGDIDKGWTVYKETTVYAVGLEKRVCKRDGCGAEETRIIPLKEKDDFEKDDFERDDFENIDYEGYTLKWHDEFNGTKLDKESWNVELHDPGWVNKELQEYVDSERNIYVEGGNLVIQTLERKDQYGRPIYTERNKKRMKTYTSGRINTKDKLDYKYGRFEARAKVPSGKGFLPAFWMMPTNENYYGQWPKCGEIDIMEVLGSNTKTAHSTLHFGDPHTQQQGTFTLSGGDFSEEFHVYACEWEPGEMRFYVDGILFYKVNDWFTQTTGFEKTAYPAPYDQPFYMILNLAVGGEWVGYPDEDAKMGDNAQLVVDYVRVYQKDAAVYEEMEKNVKVPVTDVVLRDPDENGNYIINGDFTKKESLPNGENWKLLLAEKGKASAAISNKVLHITTTEEGVENYSVQIVQADLPVEKGCRYELSYDAYADQARTMVTTLTAPDRGYERYLKNTTVNLTTTNQTFTHEFDMEAESDANGRVEFNLGNQDSAATVHISNVKLKKLEGGVQESDRLPDGNFVHNGSFDVGNDPGKLRLKYWNLDTTNCSEAKISVTNDAKREMKVEVPDTVADPEAVKVSQNVAIEGGKDNKGKDRVYILSFDARADQAKTIKSTIAGETFDAQLTTESTTYKYEFTPAQDVKGSELQFLLGASGTTYIDNVCVREDILIVNGDFSSGMSGFEVYVSDDAKVPDYTVDSLSDGDNPNPAFSIDITDTADAGWKIQLKQNNIKLEKDKWYKFSFDAKSTLNRKIMYALQRDGSGDDNWDPYSGEQKVELTGEYQTFSHTFKMTKDTDPKTILSISMGAVDGRITTKHTIKIDNITLEETEAQEIPPVEDGTEMIQNGDFSEGDAHWENAVTAPGVAEVSFADGKAVYQITNVGTEDWHIQLKYAELLTLEKDAEYAVKLKIKSSAARTVKYAFLDPSYNWYGGEDLVLKADEPEEVDYTLKVTNDTSDKITFLISMGQIYDNDTKKPIDTPTSIIEIDDISVKKISGGGEAPVTPFDGGMIKNGDFAEGDAHWEKSIWGDGAAEVTFTDGKATYKISNVGTEDSQVQLKHKELLTLEKGAEYAVKLKIKSSAARTVKYAFLTPAPSYDWYGGEDLDLTAGELKEVDYTLKVNDKETSDQITFVISMGKIEGKETPISTIEIDDISVKKTGGGSGDDPSGDDPVVEIGTELIQNGNFEAGEENWTKAVTAPGEAEVSFADKKAVFNITNVGDEDRNVQLKQSGLTLEKGASYKVNLKIKSTEARTVKTALLDPEHGHKWYGGIDIALNANRQKSISRIVKVDEDTVSTIDFVISMGKIEGKETPASTIEIDDISITKVESGAKADKETEEPDPTKPEEPDDPVVEIGTELIKNGDFAKDGADWEDATSEPGAANVSFTEGKAVYEISSVGAADHHVQLKQSGLKLEKGSTYQISLKIKSTAARTVKVSLLDPENDYAWYGGKDIELNADKQKSIVKIVKVGEDKATSETIAFQISMGKIENKETPVSTIEIADISVKKVSNDVTEDSDKDEEIPDNSDDSDTQQEESIEKTENKSDKKNQETDEQETAEQIEESSEDNESETEEESSEDEETSNDNESVTEEDTE